MTVFIRLLVNILEEGLIYGIMAMGVYVTYSVLHFPDLSVDGTFPLGACLTALLIPLGVPPVIVLFAAFAAGAAAGSITAFLHVKLKISDLLSGILTMTAMWSINLVILGGRAVSPFYNKPTVFNQGLVSLFPKNIYPRRVLIIAALIAIVIKIIMDSYYKTKSGLLLRSAGDNAQFVSSLGINPGKVKTLGLMIGNGLTALSGSVLAQQAESANVQSGTGMVVMGLAAVIIGTSIFGGVRFMKSTTMVLLGSIIYKAALVAAMQIGIPTNYLKLIMAILFVLSLMLGKSLDRRRGNARAI